MELSGQPHVPAALLPRERAPAAHRIGGWVGPRAGLDAVVRGEIPGQGMYRNGRKSVQKEYGLYEYCPELVLCCIRRMMKIKLASHSVP
jgi:hypothetical protein